MTTKLYRVDPADLLAGRANPITEGQHDEAAGTMQRSGADEATAATAAVLAAEGWRDSRGAALRAAADRLQAAASAALLAAMRAETDTVHVYFYGCGATPHHALHEPAGGGMNATEGAALPQALRELIADPTLPGDPMASQPEGAARLRVVAGWTLIAFWERSLAPVPGGRGVFLVEGEHDLASALAAARAYFPAVFERLRARGLDVYAAPA